MYTRKPYLFQKSDSLESDTRLAGDLGVLGLQCLESFLSQFPHSRVPSRVPPKTSGTKLPIIHTHRTRAPVDTHWRETRHRSEPARESAHPRRVDTQTYIHGAMVVAEKRDKTLCVLITGASRGIGLELVKQYLTRVGRGNYGRGGHVIATCRDPENSLDLLRCFQVDYVSYEVVGLDVANGQSFLDLHEHLRDLDGIEQKIDIVFNNAGVALGRDCAVGTIDYEAWHTSLNTNVMGSMRVLETVLP